jgi:transporter family protein
MVPLMTILLLLYWYPKRKQSTLFTWRYTIPLIGICLVMADFAYFKALSLDGALVSVISTVRRSSVIISFAFGAIAYREKNIVYKALCLAGILAGIVVLIVSG